MFALFLTFIAVGQAPVGVAGKTDPFTKIPVGYSLHADHRGGPSSWPSPSGRFAFGFYLDGQGFSIGINMYVSPVAKPLVIWTAAGEQGMKPFSKDAVLSFTQKGFLLMPYKGASKNINLIKFNSTESTGAAMLDSGNFVVYDTNPSTPTKNCSIVSILVGSDVKGNCCITWQSFNYPTDTMMGGQQLICGNNLISRLNTTDHSFYMLSMQCDANLVIYAVKKIINSDGNTTTESKPIWASLTYGKEYTKLVLGEGGRLFLSTPSGVIQENLSPYNPKHNQANMLYRATLAPNKYFRISELNLFTNTSTVVYEIPTLNNDCHMQYLCGLNSYCVVIENRAECRCLPGFNFTNFSDQTKGCKRSIAEPNCWPPDSSVTNPFSMEPVENLVWFDEAYSIVSTESKEDCSSTCLTECDCEAAVFFNQNCAKHKLPMSRATKETNFTTGMSTAYIKISAEGNGRNAEENERQKKYLVAVLLCGAIDAGVFLVLLVSGTGSYWLFYGRYRLLWRKWALAFQEEVAPRSFSFQELAEATNSFSLELGRGGHATIFKGYLRMYGRPNHVPVAVKRLNAEDEKGESDFQAEIRIIGRAHHVNLVRLLGFCHEKAKRLLVYEYMSWGSLADLICQSDPPSYKQKVKILLGVARGITYLHRECETKIIHRDIKPENILLAENWKVKISDFGISKFSVGGLQKMSTKRTSAPGTPGYVAPECVQSKGENVTNKADVYSFGIVVLETSFWIRNTDNNLLEFAPKYCDDIEEKRRMEVKLADAVLEMERMVKLGIQCVQENPGARPDMEDVIPSMLEGVLAAPRVSWAPSRN